MAFQNHTPPRLLLIESSYRFMKAIRILPTSSQHTNCHQKISIVISWTQQATSTNTWSNALIPDIGVLHVWLIQAEVSYTPAGTVAARASHRGDWWNRHPFACDIHQGIYYALQIVLGELKLNQTQKKSSRSLSSFAHKRQTCRRSGVAAVETKAGFRLLCIWLIFARNKNSKARNNNC